MNSSNRFTMSVVPVCVARAIVQVCVTVTMSLWCVGALVRWCVGVLVCWCVGALVEVEEQSRTNKQTPSASCSMLVELNWIGLDWIGLDWIGLDWIGLDWIGLDLGLELDWIELILDG